MQQIESCAADKTLQEVLVRPQRGGIDDAGGQIQSRAPRDRSGAGAEKPRSRAAEPSPLGQIEREPDERREHQCVDEKGERLRQR